MGLWSWRKSALLESFFSPIFSNSSSFQHAQFPGKNHRFLYPAYLGLPVTVALRYNIWGGVKSLDTKEIYIKKKLRNSVGPHRLKVRRRWRKEPRLLIGSAARSCCSVVFRGGHVGLPPVLLGVWLYWKSKLDTFRNKFPNWFVIRAKRKIKLKISLRES